MWKRKILAVILAVMLTVGMSAVALAEENSVGVAGGDDLTQTSVGTDFGSDSLKSYAGVSSAVGKWFGGNADAGFSIGKDGINFNAGSGTSIGGGLLDGSAGASGEFCIPGVSNNGKGGFKFNAFFKFGGKEHNFDFEWPCWTQKPVKTKAPVKTQKPGTSSTPGTSTAPTSTNGGLDDTSKTGYLL